MTNIFDFFRKNDIGEPPWEYDFLVNLDEREYPKYLAKIFKYRTDEKLPLKYDFKNQAWVIDKKKCKTFNQKIQWLKLYGVTDLMRKCTDKVAVRDYVKEKIGEEYLKPVLQIISSPHPNPLPSGEGWVEGLALANNDVSTYFDQIDFNKLPNAFVIKTNHGSKWQYIIKDKEQFLNNPQLFDAVKRQMTGWLEQEYFPWNGFEMQYKGLESKILIEPLMREEINIEPIKISFYCFNKRTKIIIKIFNNNEISIWDENFEPLDNIFNFSEENIKRKIDDYINQTIDLSTKLSRNFNFVRVDWMIYKDKLYFEELTFTPYSGVIKFDKKWNKTIGSYLEF